MINLESIVQDAANMLAEKTAAIMLAAMGYSAPQYMALRAEMGYTSKCSAEEIKCAEEIEATGYDLRAIMTSAHEMRRDHAGESPPPFGEFLVKAWTEARKDD